MEEQRKMKPLQKKDFGKTSKGELATVYTLERSRNADQLYLTSEQH